MKLFEGIVSGLLDGQLFYQDKLMHGTNGKLIPGTARSSEKISDIVRESHRSKAWFNAWLSRFMGKIFILHKEVELQHTYVRGCVERGECRACDNRRGHIF